ncbi:MAG: TatD family hydrolase [Ardenticatenaceae bacterium]|nr:TatD family hydrolase [Anaerolineales bacterium]MCB8941377.1 TatD family hydrolase [Ardenticatenaceae bacterium]MCB8972733.1 TatD family hydrolase [Ardenticatenaceae bacterium]
MLIDTHCHLDFERFDEDRDAVVQRAIAAGVRQIIVPALDLGNCRTVLALTEKYAGVFAAVGVHPNSSAGWQDSWIGVLRDLAQHPKVVAIGEIGLDYYWDKSPKEVQQRALGLQLELAAELNLPVIIHNRESDADVVQMLAEAPLVGRENPGVLHSFAAGWDTAVSALNLGYYLGFTGPVTFKKADELREIARKVPDDRILVETDAPFLTPHPYRGKRNEPAYVAFVAERLAEVRGVSTAVFAQQTTANAQRLFFSNQ